jgi:hypothetical protein
MSEAYIDPQTRKIIQAPGKGWTSAEWIVVIGVIGSVGVGLINAWQGNGRDNKLTEQAETLDTIKHNTNSTLTEQSDLLKDLREQVESLKVERATTQERDNPTESDGSAKPKGTQNHARKFYRLVDLPIPPSGSWGNHLVFSHIDPTTGALRKDRSIPSDRNICAAGNLLLSPIHGFSYAA